MTQRDYDLKMLELELERERLRCDMADHNSCIARLDWDVARLDLEATKLRVEMMKQLMEEET